MPSMEQWPEAKKAFLQLWNARGQIKNATFAEALQGLAVVAEVASFFYVGNLVGRAAGWTKNQFTTSAA